MQCTMKSKISVRIQFKFILVCFIITFEYNVKCHLLLLRHLDIWRFTFYVFKTKNKSRIVFLEVFMQVALDKSFCMQNVFRRRIHPVLLFSAFNYNLRFVDITLSLTHHEHCFCWKLVSNAHLSHQGGLASHVRPGD